MWAHEYSIQQTVTKARSLRRLNCRYIFSKISSKADDNLALNHLIIFQTTGCEHKV